MLNRSQAAIVITVSLAIGIGAIGRAEPASAENDPPPDISVNLNTKDITVIEDIDGDPGSSGDPGSVVEVSVEEQRRWMEIRSQCNKIDAVRAASEDVSSLQGFYDANCVSSAGDPASAARQVVASMDLHVPDIGLAPRPTTVDPNSVGLVGVPNYMWVDNPEIFTTVSDSASIDAWTISVSGQVAWVDWDMGDGQVVRCAGPGTPYEARFDLDPSPDCGHVYSVQGYYTVRATAHWVLQWSGGGQSGTVVTDRASTAPVVIGEAFAVRRK